VNVTLDMCGTFIDFKNMFLKLVKWNQYFFSRITFLSCLHVNIFLSLHFIVTRPVINFLLGTETNLIFICTGRTDLLNYHTCTLN
jgi:hypothetical protein